MVLESSQRPRNVRPLPVFDSGRSRTPEELDEDLYQQVKERAARR